MWDHAKRQFTFGIDSRRNGGLFISTQVKRLQFGNLKVEIHPSGRAAGLEAARTAGKEIAMLAQSSDTVEVIFATGASQLATLGERPCSATGIRCIGSPSGLRMRSYLSQP